PRSGPSFESWGVFPGFIGNGTTGVTLRPAAYGRPQPPAYPFSRVWLRVPGAFSGRLRGRILPAFGVLPFGAVPRLCLALAQIGPQRLGEAGFAGLIGPGRTLARLAAAR